MKYVFLLSLGVLAFSCRQDAKAPNSGDSPSGTVNTQQPQAAPAPGVNAQSSAPTAGEEGTTTEKGERITPGPNTLPVLQTRMARYEQQLKELGTDAELAATRNFNLTRNYMKLPALSLTTVNNGYDQVTALLLVDIEEPVEATKEQNTNLLRLMTFDYLDKLVYFNQETFYASSRVLLQNTLSRLQNAGVDLAGLQEEWNGRNQPDKLSTATASSIMSLLEEAAG